MEKQRYVILLKGIGKMLCSLWTDSIGMKVQYSKCVFEIVCE